MAETPNSSPGQTLPPKVIPEGSNISELPQRTVNVSVTTPKEEKAEESEALEWAKALPPYIPLIQTGLWLFLVLWLVRKFKTELSALVASLKQRIDEGGSLKAGPLELGQRVQPQSAAQQAKRIDREVEESEGIGEEPYPSSSSSSSSSSSEYFRGRYFIAEDLALRRIQEEYGAALYRQVAFNDGLELDGLFSLAGSTFGVEVKYVKRDINIDIFMRRVQNVHERALASGLVNFNLLFVLVLDDETPPAASEVAEFRERVRATSLKVIVREFDIEKLADEFGIDLSFY